MHECLTPGTLMKAQWCRSSYHSLHLCHLFSSWTPAILTDLCANRWHLYGKSWDVLLYGMDNALAQTTGGSSSLFFSTSPSLFLFQDLSWFLLSWFIHILWPYYKLFLLIKNSFQRIKLQPFSEYFQDHILLRPFPETGISKKKKNPHFFFSFFICLCQSLN